MSTFEDDRYQWRETYFVLFDPARRPDTSAIRKGLQSVFGTLHIRDSQSDESGRLEILSVASYEDFAAIDIMYQQGEHVIAEMQALAPELVNLTSTKQNRLKIEKAVSYSAKLDVMHFEQMVPIEEKRPVIWVSESTNTDDSFVRAKTGPFAARKRFQFDPERYVENVFEEETPEFTEDSEQIAQLNPNTLILVLELLCCLTGGVAIDPASGAVL